MKRKLYTLIILIFLILNISASCEEGQIDINEADAAELDELYGIGPVKAEAIINARPFESLDDLIKVYGIGEATLKKIKNQGLACVSDSDEDEADEKEESDKEIEGISGEVIEDLNEGLGEGEIKEEENIQPRIINLTSLNPKDIKTEDNKEFLSKNNLTIFGFVIFCVLLVILFLFRKNKGKKNEFK